MDLLRKELERLWDAETVHGKVWTKNRPATGQCAVTALLVQDLFGGELRKVHMENTSHYYVVVKGRVVDLTADQFRASPIYDLSVPAERATVLSNPDTDSRYTTLRKRFEEATDKVLPVEDQEHIAIRDPNYVAEIVF